MRIAILIMARGNSKRIPRKNLKEFAGRPLLEHTLEDAKKLDLPIYLITEDKEIKEIGKRYKVNIYEDKYIKEYDHNNLIYKDIYDNLDYEAYILLQPTSPLRDINLMKEWINAFIKSDADAAFSVYRMPERFYYAQAQQLNFDQMERDYKGSDKESLYTENGSFYIFKKIMLTKKHILTTTKKMLLHDKYCIDLDYPFQWKPSEIIFRQIKEMK